MSIRIIVPLAIGLSLTPAGAHAMDQEPPNEAAEETDVRSATDGGDAESSPAVSPPITTRPAYVDPLPRDSGCSVAPLHARHVVAPSLLGLAYVLVTSRRRRD